MKTKNLHFNTSNTNKKHDKFITGNKVSFMFVGPLYIWEIYHSWVENPKFEYFCTLEISPKPTYLK